MLVSIIGIIGATKISDAATNPSDAANLTTWKGLRIASGILFQVITSIMAILVVYSSFRLRHLPFTEPGVTLMVLVLLSIMCNLEAVYRITSSTNSTGWIVQESAIDVLVFMPEAVSLLVLCSLDLRSLGNIVVWGSCRRSSEPRPVRSPHETKGTQRNGGDRLPMYTSPLHTS